MPSYSSAIWISDPRCNRRGSEFEEGPAFVAERPAHLALSVFTGLNTCPRRTSRTGEAIRIDKRMIAARVALATNLRESHNYALALETIDACRSRTIGWELLLGATGFCCH
jgi:hypothetical protein